MNNQLSVCKMCMIMPIQIKEYCVRCFNKKSQYLTKTYDGEMIKNIVLLRTKYGLKFKEMDSVIFECAIFSLSQSPNITKLCDILNGKLACDDLKSMTFYTIAQKQKYYLQNIMKDNNDANIILESCLYYNEHIYEEKQLKQHLLNRFFIFMNMKNQYISDIGKCKICEKPLYFKDFTDIESMVRMMHEHCELKYNLSERFNNKF